mgnify:CR=1 FL=1
MILTLYAAAKKIVQRFVENGHIAYFAGGWVRDFLMRHPSNDIDIVTSASIEEIQHLFPKTIPVGIQFGIVIVVMEGVHFEVAIFRKESGHNDGRRPEKIEPATPEEDALRRDFTINGMFYDPLKEILYDYVGGERDLQLEVVRAIGNAHERFQEDRLRMVRAVRYASKFRFAIDPKTIEAILFHSEELFPAVAVERIWQEFEKMAKVIHFDEALVMLHRLNLLQVIFPILADCEIDDIEERVKFISLFPKESPVIAKLYELFPDASLSERLAICDFLKLSNKEKKFTEEYHRWYHLENLDLCDFAHLYSMPHAQICLKIRAFYHEESFYNFHRDQMKQLKASIKRIQEKTPLVSSEHLIKRGIKPGPEIGKLLQQAERLAINLNLHSAEEVFNYLPAQGEISDS